MPTYGSDARGAVMMSDLAAAFHSLTENERIAEAPISTAQGECLVPAPIALTLPRHRLGSPSATWLYRDANGSLLGAVARFDLSTGRKEILPITSWDIGSGPKWYWRFWPGLRPLYGLDRLAMRPDAPVLVVEGEKTAEAAASRFPEHVTVTSPGGAGAAKSTDWSPLKGRVVTIWPDADAPGKVYAQHAADAISAVGCVNLSIVTVPSTWPEGWDLADSLPAGVTEVMLRTMVTQAPPRAMDEGPLPLRRVAPEPEPFPTEVLGKYLGWAAEAIHQMTQAPMAICGQSVLAVATLAVQPHVDVLLPTGQRRPSSSFFLTIAGSGERKTSCDNLALAPVRTFLDSLRLQHIAEVEAYRHHLDLWRVGRESILKQGKGGSSGLEGAEADLQALGAEPAAPPQPRILCGEPTIEGLFKLLRDGLGFVGLFSAEGGSFVGGHGMSQDNRLKTAAYLSALWDGHPIDRVRGGEELSILHGRRLTAHLMVQPGVAGKLLGDTELLDQGLLSRILVTAPHPAAGTRLWREASPDSALALAAYNARISELLELPRQHAEGRLAELTPRPLAMTERARLLWITYHDAIEREIGPKGALASISGFASKLPEHAARLAAVLAAIDQPHCAEINDDRMAAGIALSEHYQSEALRLFNSGSANPDLILAERVRTSSESVVALSARDASTSSAQMRPVTRLPQRNCCGFCRTMVGSNASRVELKSMAAEFVKPGNCWGDNGKAIQIRSMVRAGKDSIDRCYTSY